MKNLKLRRERKKEAVSEACSRAISLTVNEYVILPPQQAASFPCSVASLEAFPQLFNALEKSDYSVIPIATHCLKRAHS